MKIQIKFSKKKGEINKWQVRKKILKMIESY